MRACRKLDVVQPPITGLLALRTRQDLGTSRISDVMLASSRMLRFALGEPSGLRLIRSKTSPRLPKKGYFRCPTKTRACPPSHPGMVTS